MRSPSHTYYPGLDGLRAVAVLLVATFHVNLDPTSGLRSMLGGLIGVDLFFVLSGFLITSLLIQEERSTGRVDLRAFYIRRSFRILPLYYLILAAYCVLILALHLDPRRAEFLTALPYYAIYLQEFPHFLSRTAAGPPFEISWSLGIEEKFYLLWPLLGFVAIKSPRRRLIAAVTVVAFFFFVTSEWRPVGSFLTPYAFIAAGCALAVLRDMNGRATDALAHPAITALALALCFVSPRYHGGVLVCLGGVLMIPGLLVPVTGVSWLLARPALAWLGRISYGFYLTHQLGLHAARRLLPASAGTFYDLSVLVVGCGVTIVAAWLIHRAFESPLIALGRRLAARNA